MNITYTNYHNFMIPELPAGERFDAAMVDIETYGLHDYAPVWAIAIVFFNWDDDATYKLGCNASVDYQTGPLKMTADKAFWDEIDPDYYKRKDIIDALIQADTYYNFKWGSFMKITDVLKQTFNGMLKDTIKRGSLIANDIDFDKTHLEQLFQRVYNKAYYPWHYRSFMSLPTIIELAKVKTGIDCKKEFVSSNRSATHNPILDCLDQITYTKQAYKALMGE